MQLLELANAYRALASGVSAEPHVIARVTGPAGEALFVPDAPAAAHHRPRSDAAIQEGLRGVVRLPSGTAHALAAQAFGIPVMGKTGTSSDYRDALFVGSTYGTAGVTVAVRIGYDDNRELGAKETGGRAALPIFREVVLGIYTQALTGTTPLFPEEMEQRITDYVAWAKADEADALASMETAPAIEPSVLPTRLMPALAFTPVSLPRPGPVFDPARYDGRTKRDRGSSKDDR